jgi:regulatory protein
MTEVGLVDDAEFAHAWVGSRHRGRNLGKRALAAELRRKGITQETVAAALDQVDPESEHAAATNLVQRKLASMRELPRATQVRRLSGMLMRKGHSPDIARRVINEALDRPDEVS